jgi:hypothetical protein
MVYMSVEQVCIVGIWRNTLVQKLKKGKKSLHQKKEEDVSL